MADERGEKRGGVAVAVYLAQRHDRIAIEGLGDVVEGGPRPGLASGARPERAAEHESQAGGDERRQAMRTAGAQCFSVARQMGPARAPQPRKVVTTLREKRDQVVGAAFVAFFGSLGTPEVLISTRGYFMRPKGTLVPSGRVISVP